MHKKTPVLTKIITSIWMLIYGKEEQIIGIEGKEIGIRKDKRRGWKEGMSFLEVEPVR